VNGNLRPLREDELDAWYAAVRSDYARGIEHDGGFAHDAAQQKADADFAHLMPERRVPDGRAVLVYDVAVDERARGRGLGRRAMEFAQEAGRRRLARVALNVFGGNGAARGLYRSLGYREVAVWMAKDL
jgi:ribosomal protein S18 acetylase RimI-like enzyme